MQCESLWKHKQYTNRKGEQKYFYQYPSKEEVEKEVGDTLLIIPGITLDEFYSDYLGINENFNHLNDLNIPYIQLPPDAQIHDYFWGDSCIGFGGTQQEDDSGNLTNTILYTYWFAFGGPNIWLSFEVDLKKRLNRKYWDFDLTRIEYGESWAMQGGHIDLTQNKDALHIFEMDFDERISIDIDDGINDKSYIPTHPRGTYNE